MARKGRRRGFLLKGKIDETLPLGTLANADVVGDVFNDTLDQEAYAISQEAIWTIRELTDDEGPIIVGVAHGDYTDAEIEEYLENAGSWTRGDMLAQEIAKRKIRSVGSFAATGTGDQVLNDGKPIKTRLGFMLQEGQTIKVWAWNKSGAALTTGAQVFLEGHVWLRPT